MIIGLKNEGRAATSPSNTEQIKNEFKLRRADEQAVEDERERQRLIDRDPAFFARIFIPSKLLFEVFIGHDDFFVKEEDYDPETVDANESWLRGQTFLQGTEYLPLLIEHTKNPANKTLVNNQKIFPVEWLAPYRANVLTPLTTAIIEVLFDHDVLSQRRTKENGEKAIELPTSKHRYGHALAEQIGQATYEQICEFFLKALQEIAECKRIGGIIQMVAGKLPMEIPKTILAELPKYGDTLEAATVAYCNALRPASIIPRPYYEFLYKVGALIMSVVDPEHSVAGLPQSRDIKKQAEECLAVIAQSKLEQPI